MQNRPVARNSSLELLRVIAMLMIVAFHFFRQGGFSFPTDSITVNRLFNQFILVGGQFGNNIFVMLSGYFLILSDGLKPQRLLNLWSKIFSWSVMIFFTFTLSGLAPFTLDSLATSLMPVTQDQWWFASTYFLLYIFHPYVNKMLHALTREEYRKFLLTIMICWCIIPMLANSKFGANETINFVCVYCIAGYVRLYPEDFGTRRYILWGIAFLVANFLSAVIIDVIIIKFHYWSWHPRYFYGMMRPFTIAAALCFLLGFIRLNIPHSKIINTMASATFGVYLIHESNFVSPFLWNDIFHTATFQDSPYLIPYSVAVILIVYISCTILELLRSRILRTLSRGKLS